MLDQPGPGALGVPRDEGAGEREAHDPPSVQLAWQARDHLLERGGQLEEPGRPLTIIP